MMSEEKAIALKLSHVTGTWYTGENMGCHVNMSCQQGSNPDSTTY